MSTMSGRTCDGPPGFLCQGTEKSDWRGAWVWSEAVERARNAYALFRRSFVLETETEIHVAITADSFYELHVDGNRIGRGPARSHLDYYGFDRHRLRLPAGAHVLAVLAHHIGVINAAVMTGRPGLLVEVSGTGIGFGSDRSWRCRQAVAWRLDLPCLMSHFGFWEECDLSRLPAGWTTVAFDDSAWTAAVEIGRPPCAPWARLVEPDLPPPARQELRGVTILASGTWQAGAVSEDDEAKRRGGAGGWLDGVSTLDIPGKQVAARVRMPGGITVLPADFALPGGVEAGRWLTVDFGRTVSGYPVLTVEAAEPGVTLDLAYDDVPRRDGSVNPERTYARMADRFRLAAGQGVVRPVHPRGFRFLTVDLAGAGTVRLLAVQALEETYPFAPPAPLATSDARLAGYARRGAETVRVCTTDAFTDCASRERVQWMEDLYLHGRVAAYAFGDTRLLRRALFQGAQNALPDGRINGFMPSERTNCAFASSSLMWLHALADYRLFAGDEPGCAQLRPTVEKLLGLIRPLTDAEGLVTSWPAGQFWDWSPIEDNGCILLTNAFLVWALSRLAADPIFAQVLDPDLPARLVRVRAMAHRRFWDADRQLYRDAPESGGGTPIYSQHANVLAVLSGICPEAGRTALLRRLIEPANLGPVPVGEQALWNAPRPGPQQIVPVGTLWFGHFLCQALLECGLAEEALAQMHALWGATGDAPTFPETRVGAGNTTQCHGWAAGPAWLIPAYVLGVRPVGPGWSQVAVAPCPGALTWASGEVPTPYGRLAVRWRREADGRLDVNIDQDGGRAYLQERDPNGEVRLCLKEERAGGLGTGAD